MTYTVESIIFDFDGVLVESNHIRTEGFRKLLKNHNFSKDKIDQLIDFHKSNGGLSRYHKIRFFFNEILKEDITDSLLVSLSQEYSSIVKQEVADCKWVDGAQDFLINNHIKYTLFIVSGSDQNELRDICQMRNITPYVKEILGSPTDKEQNVQFLISTYNLNPISTIFVGDSINDYEAAIATKVKFIGRKIGNSNPFLCLHNVQAVIDNLTELNKMVSCL